MCAKAEWLILSRPSEVEAFTRSCRSMAKSKNEPPVPINRSIGSWRGTRIEIVGDHVANIPAMLSIAGMFAREADGMSITGGLAHLDDALGGAVRRMRSDGIFEGRLGETMVLSTPPLPVRADAILMIGLGDPADWTPEVMRSVVAVAARRAMQLAVSSVAFAPSLHDSGLRGRIVVGAEPAMLTGLCGEIEVAGGKPPEQWVFCAHPAHFEVTARDFALAFNDLSAPC
jgi:hypothetical protein